MADTQTENVADTFTLFRKKVTNCATAFRGDYESYPESDNVRPIYLINFKGSSLEVLQDTDGNTRSVLAGDFESIIRNSAIVRSDNGLSSLKRNGIFTSGWSFTYLSDKYIWTVSTWNRTWTLKDANDKPIARFTRSSLKFKKIGVLNIYKQSDPVFVAIIVLTCKLVHNSVKSNERHAQ
ncbi:hypothetical protein GGI25_003076 [Coemansia spiralis]|uniref:Uncharacterized protein n=2 Tax=Coemansia TaxID=4863 RepID=A0A9W8KXX5_9FUNG|nr:hypothetical protein BX070DRAFT_254686 [Coemansia spiralis]KAJ1994576.1 hypothetical protein EDC05_001492 [Coemansia umbellata]KAJ2624382.1 hypothetical protein GGI26_001516 [Coemansia sp. RSA 1358]KAJ2677556.1 hypothetical protein GGI25_003076 [Coemansia spiralis]